MSETFKSPGFEHIPPPDEDKLRGMAKSVIGVAGYPAPYKLLIEGGSNEIASVSSVKPEFTDRPESHKAKMGPDYIQRIEQGFKDVQ